MSVALSPQYKHTTPFSSHDCWRVFPRFFRRSPLNSLTFESSAAESLCPRVRLRAIAFETTARVSPDLLITDAHRVLKV